MKIVILCSTHHFHSPIILREICLKRKKDRIIIFSTPKLAKNKSPFHQIAEIISTSGFLYLWNMSLAQIWFRINQWGEKFIQKKKLEEKKFLGHGELIKSFHLEHYQIKDINSPKTVELLAQIKPDVIIANLFNQIISTPVHQLASIGCFNIHTSPLPKYRGVAPNFWALVNKEKIFGTSIHYITDKIDSGPIVSQKEVPILERDTVFDLYRRCSREAAGLLIELLERCQREKPQGIEQDDSSASYYSRINKKAVKELFSSGRRFF